MTNAIAITNGISIALPAFAKAESASFVQA